VLDNVRYASESGREVYCVSVNTQYESASSKREVYSVSDNARYESVSSKREVY
jgi:hypothetical protein